MDTEWHPVKHALQTFSPSTCWYYKRPSGKSVLQLGTSAWYRTTRSVPSRQIWNWWLPLRSQRRHVLLLEWRHSQPVWAFVQCWKKGGLLVEWGKLAVTDPDCDRMAMTLFKQKEMTLRHAAKAAMYTFAFRPITLIEDTDLLFLLYHADISNSNALYFRSDKAKSYV